MDRIALFSLCLIVALFVACGGPGVGSAKTSGQVGPYTLDVGGTAFAIHDATDYAYDNGVLRRAERDVPELRLYLFGAQFDPTRDLRFLPIDDRLALSDEIFKGGQVRITFEDTAQVTGGANLVGDMGLIPQSSTGVTVSLVSLGLVEVPETSTYPAEHTGRAGKQTWTLDLDRASTAVGDQVKGTLVLNFEKGDFDPDPVLTGAFTIEFTAEIIPERIGECNESSGWGLEGGDEPACSPL